MSEHLRRIIVDGLLDRIRDSTLAALDEPSEAEETLIGCLFADIIRKLMDEAKLQAEKDGTRTISVGHLRDAKALILDSSPNSNED
ncbi:Wip1 [Kluyveromyces lactis]|nr:Wip1 [Kluyveromyces lactis]